MKTYQVDSKTPMSDTLRAEWEKWLAENFDLGHYDAYKVKDPEVLPYVDGEPQRLVDTDMPEHLFAKLLAEEDKEPR